MNVHDPVPLTKAGLVQEGMIRREGRSAFDSSIIGTALMAGVTTLWCFEHTTHLWDDKARVERKLKPKQKSLKIASAQQTMI